MLRPMMNAFAVIILANSAGCSSAPSPYQACSLSPQPSPPSSPNGRSSVWLSPAANPSTEIVRSQVTLPVRVVMGPAWSRRHMTSNANSVDVTLISLINAQPGPPQGSRRGGPTRVGDRGGEAAALLPAVGEPSPFSPGGGHRRQARAADRSRDQADAGRPAARQPGRRDRGPGGRGDQRAGRTGRPAG